MTNNFHDVLPTNAPLQAAVIEDRLSDLDSAITGIAAGTEPIDNLNLSTAGALTISGGAVTKTQSQHTIDTEASASTDDLTTINGYATGDVLIISAANSARAVVVKHGTGNIYLYSKMDKTLDDTDKTITLIYRGGRWEEVGGLPTTAYAHPTAAPYRRPTNMPLLPNWGPRNWFGSRAAAATIQTIGIAAPTVTANATANANQSDSAYTGYSTSNVSGNTVSIVSASYNLSRRNYLAKMSTVIQISDTTSLRFFVGFCSAVLGNVDTIAGATEAAVFRYSTGASDAGFVPVTKDASTQTTGAAMNTIAANTRYLLEIELTASSAIFTINNGTPVVQAANLPAAATDLGFNFYFVTLTTAVRTLYLSRMMIEQD